MKMKMKMKVKMLALAATLIVSNNSQAQDGSLDLTFGINGIVTTTIGVPSPSQNTFARTMVIQNDGKILVAGDLNIGIDGDFAVSRYNNDGSLDLTFGNNGIVTTSIGNYKDNVNAMEVQSDGKILIAGVSYNGTTNDFALVRYNNDGSLDATFDTDGVVTTNVRGGHDKANAITIQPDGKIILAGYASSSTGNNDIALTRYNSDGSLDMTFGNAGIILTTIGNSNSVVKAIKLKPDGKILVVGHTLNNAIDFVLAQYNSDGNLDLTFDNDGIVTTSIGNYDVANAINLQPDGKILLAGYSTIGTSPTFALARYNTDGSLDLTFDNDGIVTTTIGNAQDAINSINLQMDGKILVAGSSLIAGVDYFTLVRYNSDGSLDLTFGSNGIVTTSIGNFSCVAHAMNLQADGKILVAGYTHDNGAGIDFALVRYNNTITNINTIQEDKLNMLIYPNPFSSLATVEFDVVIYDAELSIYNVFGQKVKTISNISGRKISLNCEELTSGFYVLNLTQNKKIIATDKIVLVD